MFVYDELDRVCGSAVSYTHLDVYKRQRQHAVKIAGSFCQRQCFLIKLTMW